MSLARLKQKLKKLDIQRNSEIQMNAENTDYQEWINKIESQGNKPDAWLKFLFHVNEHTVFTDKFAKHNHLCVLFEKAFSSIPCEINRTDEAYAQLFIEFAEIKSQYVPEDAQTLLSQARSLCKRFAKIHLAAADLELKLGNDSKARKILQKAQSFQAEPEEDIVLALKKLEEGRTTQLEYVDSTTETMPVREYHENTNIDLTEESAVFMSQGSDTMPLGPESKKFASEESHRPLRTYNSTPEVRSVKKTNPSESTWKRPATSSKRLPPPQRVRRLQLPFQVPTDENEKENLNDTFDSFKPLNHANSTLGSTSLAQSSGYLSMTEPGDTRDTRPNTAPLSPILSEKYENDVNTKSIDVEMADTPRESTASQNLKKMNASNLFKPFLMGQRPKTILPFGGQESQNFHNSTQHLLAQISQSQPSLRDRTMSDTNSRNKSSLNHKSPDGDLQIHSVCNNGTASGQCLINNVSSGQPKKPLNEVLEPKRDKNPVSKTHNRVPHELHEPHNRLIQNNENPQMGQKLDEQRANLDMLTVNGQLYSVLGIVGRGGSSKVYQVFDIQKRMIKSVKVVNLDNANDMIIEGYMNEINLLERLQYSDRVIKMYDYAHDAENYTLYVVMEYGKPDLATFFKNQVKQGGRLSDHLIKYYWEVMLQAVQALHKEGIIHSDLKPANFLIVDGALKLIDFGIAKALQQDKTGVLMETQVGTLNYMSPEALMESCGDSSPDENGQYRPVYKIGVRSDVWSLGCILYNMVYGRTPFQHITRQFAKLQAICNPKCLIDFPDIQDKLLMDVMKKCLTRNPKERPHIDELLQHSYLCAGS
ncbi:hypothetical protein ScPMuIL_012000 [Solemya velum]